MYTYSTVTAIIQLHTTKTYNTYCPYSKYILPMQYYTQAHHDIYIYHVYICIYMHTISTTYNYRHHVRTAHTCNIYMLKADEQSQYTYNTYYTHTVYTSATCTYQNIQHDMYIQDAHARTMNRIRHIQHIQT